MLKKQKNITDQPESARKDDDCAQGMVAGSELLTKYR